MERLRKKRLARLRRTTVLPGTGPNGATEFDAFPTLDVGSYPAILYLCDINIENHGINYSDGDRVVIEPSNGTEVVPTFGPFGVLQSIRIVKAGKGFIERPLIYVESETGYNAILRPVFCVDRIGDDTDGDVPDDPILGGIVSIVNCVGIVANDEFAGYINGQPYYGPTHQHRGVKMVGAQHTQRPHPLVWDSVSKSLDNYDNRFQWVNGNLLQVIDLQLQLYLFLLNHLQQLLLLLHLMVELWRHLQQELFFLMQILELHLHLRHHHQHLRVLHRHRHLHHRLQHPHLRHLHHPQLLLHHHHRLVAADTIHNIKCHQRFITQ